MKDNLGEILFTIIIVAFIGGCSYTLTNDDKNIALRDCISADMNYINGDCVKP